MSAPALPPSRLRRRAAIRAWTFDRPLATIAAAAGVVANARRHRTV